MFGIHHGAHVHSAGIRRFRLNKAQPYHIQRLCDSSYYPPVAPHPWTHFCGPIADDQSHLVIFFSQTFLCLRSSIARRCRFLCSRCHLSLWYSRTIAPSRPQTPPPPLTWVHFRRSWQQSTWCVRNLFNSLTVSYVQWRCIECYKRTLSERRRASQTSSTYIFQVHH